MHLDESVEAPPYSPISAQSSPALVATEHVITSTPNSLSTSLPTMQNCEQLEPHEELPRETPWSGFVLVGDNIDKSVNARHQTMELRNRSLHYFNSYAVLDRCNFSHLPEFQPPIDRSAYDMKCLLPSDTDIEAILLHFSVLVGRMLTSYVPGFEKYKLFPFIIKHKYSSEMKKKSDVVSI